jgi:hypothetical protein
LPIFLTVDQGEKEREGKGKRRGEEGKTKTMKLYHY